MAAIKLIFTREPRQGIRTWCLVALSVVLMVADYRYHHFNVVRDYFSLTIYPIQWLVDSPVRLAATIKQYTSSYQQLVQENEQLRHEQLLQNARTQKFMALEAENIRLRSLLQSSPRNSEALVVAEIIRVDSDPLIHRVILDKGSRQGVTLGQTVIDAEGVIGEVIEVNPLVSRVILLTDTSYGIPVENVRNGVRGIAAGTGAIKNLELQHVPNTIDFKVGDTLVTSGLDGRYPPGYPVGVISQIQHDPGESFARVLVTPSAHLERTRQVLLVQRLKEDIKASVNTDKTRESKKQTESDTAVVNAATTPTTMNPAKSNPVEVTTITNTEATNKQATVANPVTTNAVTSQIPSNTTNSEAQPTPVKKYKKIRKRVKILSEEEIRELKEREGYEEQDDPANHHRQDDRHRQDTYHQQDDYRERESWDR